MSHSLLDLLDPRCVEAKCRATDDADVIHRAARLLAAVGAVEAGYGAAAVARERSYATGLATEPVGVALPHIDEGVRHSALSLVTLEEPVLFTEMGTLSDRVPVSVVVMIAVPPGHAHMEALGSLAELIQQPKCLEALTLATDATELYRTFQSWAVQSKEEA